MSSPNEEPEARFTASGRSGSVPSRSWWSGRWLRSLSNWLSTTLLATGRLYVRRQQVYGLEVQVGMVSASVHEPDGSTCHVRIGVATFPDEVWEAAVRMMSEKVAYAASLLNNEIPRDIEDVFLTLGAGLFPERRSEFDVECSCPEWASYCPHVAATLVLVGDRLDEDPFLLFRLRGRAREQLLAELRSSRSLRTRSSEGPAPAGRTSLAGVAIEEPLDARLDEFWSMGAELDALQIRVRPPEVDMEVIKLLGVPTFVNEEGLLQRLAKVYRTVSEAALDVAYEEYAEALTDEDMDLGADEDDPQDGADEEASAVD